MKEIGGYFGLELGPVNQDYPFRDMIHLNSGRHALEYILMHIEHKPEKIYIPYYTCEVVLEPLLRLGIPYSFYHINERMELAVPIELKANEYIIANNYFGIKDRYMEKLHDQYGEYLIIDEAQALFHKPLVGARHFYSPRKFVGVPDGGFAVTWDTSTISLTRDFSTDRALHLLRRIDAGAQSGFNEFRKNDSALTKESLKIMSHLTTELLERMDYSSIINKRQENFKTLHNALCSYNGLDLTFEMDFQCPLVYPYLTADNLLRNRLIENKVYVARYWPNVYEWCNEDSFEYTLADRMLPLPIDQRYSKEDMERIISMIIP